MKTILLLTVSALLLFLTSCQSLRNTRVAEDFDKGSKAYFKMVRWNELENAPLYFVDDSLRDEFRKRVEAVRGIQIADYRVKEMECLPVEGKAVVTVEWDYYLPPSVTLKTIVDPQKWRYIEEKERRGWILMTLFPEFKEQNENDPGNRR